MRVLLAGASGAIGRPLTRQLLRAGHEVIGISRTARGAARIEEAGGSAVIADVMDREDLLRALEGHSADAVLHELTALSKMPMRHRDMAATNRLREQGTVHLIQAAGVVGATRFITQSIVFGYGFRDHGDKILTEEDPFGVREGNRLDEIYAALVSTERQATQTQGIDGMALRYGAFYGPHAGTDAMADLLRKRMLPAPRGHARLPLVYIDDAAAATVAALERGQPGQVYNVVDDDPVETGTFLDTIADAYRTPRPMRVPGAMLRVMPYVHAFLTMSMRVSNAKAQRDLGWKPAYPSYREGVRETVHQRA